MTIKDLQNWGYKKLADFVFNPEFEADALLSYVLKKERSFLYAHPEHIISKNKIVKFKNLIRRRQKKEPFAYLVGKMEFYDLEFKVNKNVLIPRPETEELVAEAIKEIGENKFKTVIDVGTGSGAILVAIAANVTKRLRFLGTDISAEALNIARQNAKKILNGKKDVKFSKGNLLLPAKSKPHPQLVVANLPYLTPEEVKKEELKFEPKVALAGGEKGLNLIDELIKQFAKAYKPGDVALLEIGYRQAAEIKKLVNGLLPDCTVEVNVDFSGYDRIIKIF